MKQVAILNWTQDSNSGVWLQKKTNLDDLENIKL